MPFPVYEGDTVEDNGVISYVIDLQDKEEETIMSWLIMRALLNMNSSPFKQKAVEMGIQSPVSVELSTDSAKPFLEFRMDYANADQTQLKDLAMETLTEISENGLNPELLEAVIKGEELATVMSRNGAQAGIMQSSLLLTGWARTGEMHFYRNYEEALFKMAEDEDQEVIKALAADALHPRRSALVASIPEPGLAEKHDEKMEKYLQDLKAGMSEEEIEKLVADTRAFNAWNEEEQPNNDFLIDPEDLPDPEPVAPFEKFEKKI